MTARPSSALSGSAATASCADHNVAWRVREALGLDKAPAGPGPDHNDEIIYDIVPGMPSASGYGHAQCKGSRNPRSRSRFMPASCRAGRR